MTLPRTSKKLTLKAKLLVLFTLVSAIPLIFVNILWFGSSKNQILRSAETRLTIVTGDIALQVEDYLKEKVIGLTTHAQTDAVLNQDIPKATSELQGFLLQDQDIQELSLIDKSGKELIRLNRTKIFSPQDLVDLASSSAFMAAASLPGKEYISPIYHDPNGDSEVDISIGGTSGVLKESLKLTSLWKNITTTTIGQHGYVYLIDGTGDVIAHPNSQFSSQQKNLKGVPEVDLYLSEFQKSSTGKLAVSQTNNEYGQESLTSHARISPTNWAVIAEVPVSDTFSDINLVLRFAIILFLVLVVIVIFTSLWLSNQIVEPVLLLQQGVAKIANGDFNYHLSINTGDEIESLSEEFNNMADTLRRNISQLTYQNKLLSALRNIDAALMSNLELKPLSQKIADLIVVQLGYLFGGIALIDQEKKVLSISAFSKNDELSRNIDKIILDETAEDIEEKTLELSDTTNILSTASKDRESLYADNLYHLFKGLISDENCVKVDYQIKQKYPEFKGMFIYPLISKSRVMGVIFYGLGFSQEEIPGFEINNMENFTGEVSKAIDNAMLYHYLDSDRSVISGERNKLSVVLSGIKDAVIAIDLQKRVVTFNRAAEILTGFRFQDAVGKPISSLIKLFNKNEEVKEDEYCPLRTDGFEGILFSKENLRLVGKDNKTSFVEIVSGQIREGLSINLGCILTFHDITREEELEEMKLDFVSMAAHELRTPLTSVRGYLSVFIEENHDKLNDEQNMFLNRINISTKQLMALIENLLNVSKIERGVFSVNLSPVDWVLMVRETVGQFVDRAKDKNINLSLIEPEGEIPKIIADPLRINEVLSNLLSNAISYTQSGGTIEVSLQEKDGEVETHVKDSGEGIPESAMPHLFTKFFRAGGKLAQGSKGTGLGLYISKSIIEMHHGKIWVDSEVDKGSVFSFSVPAEKRSDGSS